MTDRLIHPMLGDCICRAGRDTDGSEFGPCTYCEEMAWRSENGLHDEDLEAMIADGPAYSDHRSIEFLAYQAFRSGCVTPELQRYAGQQIKARGLQPAIDRALEEIERAFVQPKPVDTGLPPSMFGRG